MAIPALAPLPKPVVFEGEGDGLEVEEDDEETVTVRTEAGGEVELDLELVLELALDWMLFCVGGPSVPEIDFMPVCTVGGNSPVMLESEKRPE